jgi:hypothetical protein
MSEKITNGKDKPFGADIIKTFIIAVLTGIVATYLSIIVTPADFEVYVEYPKIDLNSNINMWKNPDNPDYTAYIGRDTIKYSLKNLTININDANTFVKIWPFWPYPKKYNHNIYLNYSINQPGITIDFNKELNRTPFKSTIDININSTIPRGDYEARIGALGGDGKYHSCPLHIRVYNSELKNERPQSE